MSDSPVMTQSTTCEHCSCPCHQTASDAKVAVKTGIDAAPLPKNYVAESVLNDQQIQIEAQKKIAPIAPGSVSVEEAKQKCKTLLYPRARRCRGPLPESDHPVTLAYLKMFGVDRWTNDKVMWTQQDLVDRSITETYLNELRAPMLKMNFPLTQLRKLKLAEVTVKDLITLLGQLARLYGFRVESTSKPQFDPDINRVKNRQVYRIVPDENSYNPTPLIMKKNALQAAHHAQQQAHQALHAAKLIKPGAAIKQPHLKPTVLHQVPSS